MAILKALPSRRNPQAIQQYLLQEKKLRNSFISGSQVRARNFGKQFDQVQQLYGKTTGRRYYHYILSFSSEETQQLSPREVHQMGVELAEEFFGKQGYQFAVVTHTDTDHLHDHIVVNAVNLETGKKAAYIPAGSEANKEPCQRALPKPGPAANPAAQRRHYERRILVSSPRPERLERGTAGGYRLRPAGSEKLR